MRVNYPDLTQLETVTDDLSYQKVLDQWLDTFSNQLQLASIQLEDAYPELVSQILFVLVTSRSDSPEDAAQQLEHYAHYLRNKLGPLHNLMNSQVH